MKASISFEKECIKIEGDGKKVIVPIYPSRENPWEKPYDQEGHIRRLYQIIGNNEYNIEPKENREIHLASPLSVSYN